MANVLFKRGLQADLPASGSNSVVDGALYFTTDTKRLFLGNGTNMLPIAEGIQVVTSVSDLPTASDHNGEFYYLTAGNILAWSDGSTWLQTNPNTKLKADQRTALSTDTTDIGKVKLEFEDTDGTKVVGSFKIAAGTSNVTIGRNSNDGSLTISVDPDTTYELKTTGGASDNTNDDVVLQLDSSKANDDSSIALKNSNSVTVKRDQSTGAISFDINPNGVGGITSTDIIEGSGAITNGTPASPNGFTSEIVLSNGQRKYASTDPTIKYGENAAQEVHFVNGAATLDVLTRTEVNQAIDDLEKTINAMTYRGAVSSANEIPSSITAGGAYHNGDVYLADNDFTINGTPVKPGYLIVIQGSEGTDGTIPAANVNYEIITGNSTDTTYQIATVSHGIDIKSGNAVIGEIKLTAGDAIDLTDTTSANGSAVSGTTNINSIQIKHANITRNDTHVPASGATDDDRGSETAVQTARAPMTFMVVDEVTTNNQGHVTAVNYKKVTVQDSTLNVGAFTTTSTAANNVATVQMQSGGTDKLALQFKLASTGSINVTGSGDTTTIDVVWGSF